MTSAISGPVLPRGANAGYDCGTSALSSTSLNKAGGPAAVGARSVSQSCRTNLGGYGLRRDH